MSETFAEKLRQITADDNDEADVLFDAADLIEELQEENERLGKNARSDAKLLAAYHKWCEMNGCAPSSQDLSIARAERAEREKAEAVAAEREACARILDRREEMETEISKRHSSNGKHFKAREAAHVARIAKSDAAAIRARSQSTP